jgi:hypothetical protein
MEFRSRFSKIYRKSKFGRKSNEIKFNRVEKNQKSRGLVKETRVIYIYIYRERGKEKEKKRK